MKLVIKAGHGILAYGPATIRASSGNVLSLGKSLTPDEPLIVRAGRTKIVEASSDSEIDVVLGQSGKVDEVDSSTIPSEWTAFARKITQNKGRRQRIMILGGLDTGKNTLITYASNMLIAEGSEVAVMDADMGQGEIGPPTTMSVATLNEPISELLDYNPDSLFFVGATSPAHLVVRVLFGTKNLVAFVEQNAAEAVLLINMPGWITGSAAAHFVHEMISTTGADHLAVLQREGEVEHILSDLPPTLQVERLPVSPYAVPRSKEERKFLRETSYRKYFSKVKPVTAHYDKIDFSPLFSSHGNPASPQAVGRVRDAVRSGVLYCEETERSINAVVLDYADARAEIINEDVQQQDDSTQNGETAEQSGQKELRVISLRELDNVIVAVARKNRISISLGILKKLDFHSRRVSILATDTLNMIDTVEVGKVKVSPHGSETGYAEIHRIQA